VWRRRIYLSAWQLRTTSAHRLAEHQADIAKPSEGASLPRQVNALADYGVMCCVFAKFVVGDLSEARVIRRRGSTVRHH